MIIILLKEAYAPMAFSVKKAEIGQLIFAIYYDVLK